MRFMGVAASADGTFHVDDAVESLKSTPTLGSPAWERDNPSFNRLIGRFGIHLLYTNGHQRQAFYGCHWVRFLRCIKL